jgi:hypothetical protein
LKSGHLTALSGLVLLSNGPTARLRFGQTPPPCIWPLLNGLRSAEQKKPPIEGGFFFGTKRYPLFTIVAVERKFTATVKRYLLPFSFGISE